MENNLTALGMSIQRNKGRRNRIILEIERMERNADGDTDECKCAIRQRSLIDWIITEDEKLLEVERKQIIYSHCAGAVGMKGWYSFTEDEATKYYQEKYGTDGK